MVSCVEEDRVRLARSHCVLRHLCAPGVLYAKCEPIVDEPIVSNGIDRVTIHGLLYATNFQSTLQHPRETPLVKTSNKNHTVSGSSLAPPLFFVV